jgi:hypothetical protein
MINLKNLIVSESISVDKETGNLSIFNVFTNISALTFPIANKIIITIILTRDKDDNSDGFIELLIKQKNIPDVNYKVPFSFHDKQGTNLLIKYNNFVISGPGEIEFIAKIGAAEIKNTISVTQI